VPHHEWEEKLVLYCQEVQAIDDQYNLIANERDSIYYQVTLKETNIRELETRMSTISQRITSTLKIVEECRVQAKGYEEKELELRQTINQTESKIAVLTKECEDKHSRICTLEEYIKRKEERIVQLTQVVTEKETVVKSCQEENKKNNSSMYELKGVLEAKCAEIQAWHAESQSDNIKLSELAKLISCQSATIRGWEEENDRDDARQDHLEHEIKEKDAKIHCLREHIADLRNHFEVISQSTQTLSVVDESRSQETVQTAESCAEKYSSLAKEDDEKDRLLAQLYANLNSLKQTVWMLISERCELNEEIEQHRLQIAYETNSCQVVASKYAEYEEKVKVLYSQQETESNFFASVQGVVKEHKKQSAHYEKEIHDVFEHIDCLLD
jgi:chromosome segregation ATPase